MKKMNKKIYFGVYLTSFIAALLLAISPIIGLFATQGMGNAKREPLLMSLLSLAVLGLFQFAVTSIICVCLMLYKMWDSINDGHARATPGKAVGFLFIPFFNLYWIFQAWGGFPADYNAYVDRYQLPAPHLSPGIYTAYPILILLSAIPFLGIVIAIIGTFVFLAIVSKTCNAINLLEAAKQEPDRLVSYAPLQNQMTAAV